MFWNSPSILNHEEGCAQELPKQFNRFGTFGKEEWENIPKSFFTGVCRLSLYSFNDVQIKFRLLFAYKHRSVHIHVDEHIKHVTQTQMYLLDAKEQTSFRLNCFYDN